GCSWGGAEGIRVSSSPPTSAQSSHQAPGGCGSSSSPRRSCSERAGPELERSLQFLQQQHGETLRQLHQEIDRLKRRNQGGGLAGALWSVPSPLLLSRASAPRTAKALLLKAKRAGGGGRREAEGRPEGRRGDVPGGGPSAWGQPEGEPGSRRPRRSRRGRPAGPLPVAPTAQSRPARDSAVCDRRTSPMSLLPPPASHSRAGDVKIPSASSNPFLVNVLPSYMRKPPSLEECEVVIRQLWNINHMQMQEVTPWLSGGARDAPLQALEERGPLQISSRPPTGPALFSSRILTPLPAAERAVLPALKQTLGNAFAERQKRTQAVQRNRLHRTAL
uniref:Coiled-coil domain containing 74B n=1 Tax=Naja naja TaxID=35670 RepID=A0A8C6YCA6_NAJNA